nr:MAG TPA: hypothetical protein [Caudoviricetes sp.]
MTVQRYKQCLYRPNKIQTFFVFSLKYFITN